MAHSPYQDVEALIEALGLKADERRITGAVLSIKPGHLVTLDVTYIIQSDDIPLIAEAVAKYRLVRES